MMKRKLFILPILGLAISVGSIFAFPSKSYVSLSAASSHSHDTPTEAAKQAVMAKMNGVTSPYTGTYYDGVKNTQGLALKTELFNLIKDHTVTSYNSVETILLDCDKRPDGTMWDMYGDYAFVEADANGSYKVEGDYWNKEHMIPQSWFSKSSPMVSDAHHLFATDGKINGYRSNYLFGEVGSVEHSWALDRYLTYETTQYNKLGASKLSGYTGKVFEPADCYKGDIARVYFYFVTRYQDTVSGYGNHFGSDTSETNKLFNLTSYSKELFLRWHRLDPVCQKEVDRNNEVEKHQENRNPYIDHPEYVEAIWGDTPVSTVTPTAITPTSESISLEIGETSVASFTVTPSNASTSVTYASNNASVATVSNSGVITAKSVGNAQITITSTLDTSVKGVIDVEVTPELEPISIYKTGSPTKTTYYEGDTFDPSGIKIFAKYEGKNDKDVTSLVTYSPSTLSIGDTSVTASYKGLSLTISGLTVKEKPQTESFTITFADRSGDASTALDSDGILALASYNPTSASSYVKDVGSISKIFDGATGLKFGSSSASGSLTINFTQSLSIEGITLGLKKYSSDTGSVVIKTSADSTGKTFSSLTSSVVGYEYSKTSSITSVSISTTAKRAYLSYISIATSSSEPVGPKYTDLINAFAKDYLHMDDYNSNNGWCKDETHHYYQSAKARLLELEESNSGLINEFISLEIHLSYKARYENWARANYDNSPYGQYASFDSGLGNQIFWNVENNGVAIAILITASIFALSAGLITFFNKKAKRR